MWWIDAFGWICAIVGSVVSLPQVVRLLRSRTTAGLALLMWQLQGAAALAWTLHGIRGGWWNVIVPNALIALLSLLVVGMVQRDRALPVRRVWPLVVAVLAVLAAVEWLTTPALFGASVLLPLAVGFLGQSRDLVRASDLAGLSPSTVVMSAVVQYMWLAWGLAAGDVSIVICAGVLGVIALFNFVWYALRTGGRVRVAA